jgi:hypothetical protein
VEDGEVDGAAADLAHLAPARAADLLLSCRVFEADEAYELGTAELRSSSDEAGS